MYLAKKWRKQGYILLYILPLNGQYINHNKVIIIAALVEISEWCNLPILDVYPIPFNCHLRGTLLYSFFLIHVTVANSRDPDQTSYFVESDLCLHCLPYYVPFLGFQDRNG